MKLLIVGATSAIAQEAAKLFARDKASIYLVGRDDQKVEALRHDLLIRGAAQVGTMTLDLSHLEHHQQLFDTAVKTLHGLDAVLIAHGTLSDQKHCESSVSETLKELTTNCLSVISLLTIMANFFERQKRGCLAVISSVAGDRGRQSNYVYGTAKGAVSIFSQGLRNRLSKSGVAVLTIKPGFVDTPMTAGVKKNALFADPEFVGKRIYDAIRKPEDVVYVPWFWLPIMTILRSIPERIFKSLSL